MSERGGTAGAGRLRRLLRPIATGLAAVSLSAGAAEKPDPDDTFAQVGELRVTVGDYARALHHKARNTFYHGSVPKEQLTEFQQEVADELVERVLIVQEARRRELCEVPPKQVMAKPAAAKPCRENLRQAVEESLPEPTREQLQQYYADHPDAFTEPEQRRVSLILLSVPPSAPQSRWEAARERAEALRQRILDGASFQKIAREHSDDRTADKGGDMGYMHEGMLGAPAREALADLATGELSEPKRLLEGIALFRLEARKPPERKAFAEVRDRAQGLFERERAERAWKDFIARIRREQDIDVRQRYVTAEGAVSATTD